MTIEDPDMKPLTGVCRQPDTSNWSYQKKVPKELLSHPAVGGKVWGFRGSLEAASLRDANAKAAAKLARSLGHPEGLTEGLCT